MLREETAYFLALTDSIMNILFIQKFS